MTDETQKATAGILDGDWQRLSPWSLIFFALVGGRWLTQQGIYLLLPLVLVFQQSSDTRLVTVVLLALVGGLMLTAWLGYRRFCFRFLSDRLEVQQGVVQQSQTLLHYPRIQNIAISTPWYYRPLRLVTLKVESAGAGGQEVHLAAITEHQAEQIRHHLYQVQHQVADQAPVAPDDESAFDASAGSAQALSLHRARGSDLLCYAASNLGLVWALVALGPLIGNRATQRWIESLEGGRVEQLLSWSSSPLWPPALLLAAITAVLALLMAASVVLTLVRYQGFHLQRQGDRLVAQAGLLTRREQSLRSDKIQNLKLQRPWLQRWRGRTTLKCQQATDVVTTGDRNQREGILMPAVPKADLPALLVALTPEAPAEPASADYSGVHPRVWRAPFILVSLVACLLSAWLAAQQGAGVGVAGLVSLVAVAYWASRRRWRQWGLCVVDDHLFVRQGFVGVSITQVALCRVQSVSLRQSPLHRLLQVADLRLVLASGAIRVPCLPLSLATRVADQALEQSAGRAGGAL